MANLTAKAKKAFHYWHLAAAKDICGDLFGKAAVTKVADVPLSASTTVLFYRNKRRVPIDYGE